MCLRESSLLGWESWHLSHTAPTTLREHVGQMEAGFGMAPTKADSSAASQEARASGKVWRTEACV